MPDAIDREATLKILNEILEAELAGVVRYTHYSFMVFGFHRIPITGWLRGQATECLDHAHAAGELITHFDGHPSLAIGALLESHKHDLTDILRESLEHEEAGLALYRRLLGVVAGKSILLEEYARKMIAAEEQHSGEVRKMLHAPAGAAATAGAKPRR